MSSIKFKINFIKTFPKNYEMNNVTVTSSNATILKEYRDVTQMLANHDSLLELLTTGGD